MQSRSGMTEVHFGDSEEARQDETKGRPPVWKPSQQSEITLLLQATEDPRLGSVIVFPPYPLVPCSPAGFGEDP